ncbi:MAG: hypothetical protein IPO83_19330, partial [Chitinophagaceae bacterium]|nr:hypothetical protein [Chitinophagaceae bacterium]
GISAGGAATTENIFKNTICDISGSNASSTVNGILISAGTTVTLSNNRVGDLRAPSANAANPINGINITGGTTVNVVDNTVNLAATSSVTLFGSSAISVSTTPTVTFNNNIFVNTSSTVGAGLAVAYRRSTATIGTYGATSNRNDFAAATIYTDGTNTFTAIGPGAGTYKNFVSTRDVNAISVAPSFLSTTCGNANFLKIDPATASQLESGGANLAGITDDFEGTIRQGNPGYLTQTNGGGTAPDIGADEFDGIPAPVCTGIPATSTINGAASVCTGTGTTLSLSVVYTDLSITYQWRSSTTPGGPYLTNMGTAATQATGNLTVPTYYVCDVICNNGGPFTMTTVEKSVLVNPLPSVTASPTSASYCTPGGSAVSLTASNASTYTWAPAAGLNLTTGASVSATPSSTTTYTVTGTDANGCVNTATAAITVAVTPQNVLATATPSAICSGGTSNLTSSAYVQNTASLANTYTFAGATGTYVAISGTSAGASAIGDDVGVGNLPIGFSFNYNGTSETVFAVSSNGMIQLGNTSPTITGFSANALATTAKIIAPLWEDNNTTGGAVEYLTTGSVGSRILTVQWTGMHVGSSGNSGQPTISLQVKLYETTGIIQFIYGATSAAFTSTTASIGISGASGNYRSVTPLSPPNTSTTSTVTENTSVSSAVNFPTGTTYTFTAPSLSLSYAWSPSGDVVSASSQNTATNALLATETFTVTASNGGCSATATATVSLAGTMSVAVNSPTICSGNSATLTAVVTGGAPAFTYTWAPSLGLTPTTGVSVSANPTATTIYTVTATDLCGTIAMGTSTVTVNPTPSASISPAGPISTCTVGTQVLTASTNGVSPTYQWARNGTNIVGATNATHTPATSGSYTVIVTDGPCSGTSTAVSVTVNPTPSTVTVTPSHFNYL